MRKSGVLILFVAILAAGCSKSTTGTSPSQSATPTAAAPQTYSVVLDGKTDAFNGEFGTFFPSSLTVHAGDTVNFSQPRASGVPHTVTLGTLVNKGVAAYQSLGVTASFFAQETNPDVLNLPDVFPHTAPKGPPDVNHSATEPCFLPTGVPPLSLPGGAPACAKTAQPDFDGTQSFYNSGLLAKDGDSFSVKLASSIKPGSYSIICLVHRGGMTATLNVAAPGASADTPAAVTAAGTKQFNDTVARMTPIAQAAQVTATTTTAVAVGSFDTRSDDVIADLGPKSLSVKVGTKVTFTFSGFHTLAFNAPDSSVGLITKDPSGVAHLGPAGAPQGGWTVPGVFGAFPPPPTQGPLTADLGTYAGTGVRNSGIVGSLPPSIYSVTVRFTQKGTVPIRCLIHPEMKGEVKVG